MSWTAIFNSLKQHLPSAYTGTSEEIKIPDTVVFKQNEPINWYYSPTDGFGVFSHSEISPPAIFKQFTTHTVSSIVATVTWFETNNNVPFIGYLDEEDLCDLLLKENVALPYEWILQRFIEPDVSGRFAFLYY